MDKNTRSNNMLPMKTSLALNTHKLRVKGWKRYFKQMETKRKQG